MLHWNARRRKGKVMMSQQKLIPQLCSVVCTTYNQAEFCERSLQSIFDQDYRNIEIVVIDDGSTDDNVAALERALARSPFPYRLITQENTANIAVNINRALAAATGEYLCLLSLDDLLLPDCLSTRIRLLEANPDKMFVANTCNIEIDKTDSVTNDRYLAPMHGLEFRTAADLLEHEYTHIGTFYVQGGVFRRAIFDAVGGYDEDMTGDDLIIRTKIFRYMVDRPSLGFSLLDKPGFAYRKHGNNIHRDTFRQLKTVLEWRNRYFPERPLPEAFRGWSFLFFSQCLASRDKTKLEHAFSYSKELKELFQDYRSTWKYRRRAVKNYIRRIFGVTAKY
ncbi:glycosyltransferase family 2 protein [Pseudorhodobacter sp. E13]|uniref:glycosyltransferase family 2 protein n=1 Tax=Pseudorhodobacter sp. E13 TaxID=2487931 RepID=UPI000F8E2F5C|nr:glycosyltransferase family 2 protein [Pseudorhodobacter sp. E13]RUS65232.1 glycosyltransferase family 2 protein [Pseudorhodobacter sp. E13]